MRIWVAGLAVAVVVVAGGCTYREGGIFNPITRKFQYFSYLGGDDIRSACVPGAPARYRLVYNGVYDEQVRAHELRRNAPGSGAVLETQVFGGGGNLAAGFNPLDPTGPWRGTSSTVQLDENTYLALIRAIEASGFGEPTPIGLTLPSWGFYWVVAACADGRFHFNAWLHPSARFDRIQFDKVLFRVDGSNVAVNPPRRLNAAEHRLASGAQRNDPTVSTFDVRVGENGLVGNAALF